MGDYNLVDSLNVGGVTGNLYTPNTKECKVGIVLGPGILGSRWGIHDTADKIVTELQQPVITLDPPSHFENEQEFRFGNYATSMRIAAQYLRDKYRVNKFVGGGHSGGAVAAIFANLGYSKGVEDIVIDALVNKKPYDAKKLEDALREFEYLPQFNGLILASMPRDVRAAIHRYAFNPHILKVLHGFFLLQNSGEKTPYLGKSKERPHQWKQMAVSDLDELKKYVITLQQNPLEYIEFLGKLKEEELGNLAQSYVDSLKDTQKLFLVPGKDIVNFGPKVLFDKSQRESALRDLREIFDKFGVRKDSYVVYPHAAHFLNSTDKFELDSLFGLQAPEVQREIIGFIRDNF